VADRRLTGVLLVGGASERFGAPKALARLAGETLAERGWRTLGEACDEVIAVGKVADGLPLPFPLLDDGVTGRAPVFGVVAALRAAAHDVCVVLPVDCPLVTGEVIRDLGTCVAVPAHDRPLPGAYHRSSLSMIEERLARGELSLRGVNHIVRAVDDGLLIDVDTRADLDLLASIVTKS
jgi:molybdopterin-guanine dinucleotide biosynthesis protein A